MSDPRAVTGNLEARHLVKDFRLRHGARTSRLHAVRDVSVTLVPGRTVALVGESGSGKSTIARIIAKLETPTSGEVLLDGRPSAVRGRALARYRREVQMVFQDPFGSLNPFHSILHHVERPVRIHHPHLSTAEVRDRAHELLERVRLTPARAFSQRRPHELSGGQRQRVAIARALAPGARFIVADEPVSMLDVSIRLGVLNLLAELQRQEHLGVLYITHDLATARHFSDEILVMYCGEIVERGPSDRVILDPHHEYTKTLLDAAADPDRLGRLRDEVREKDEMSQIDPGTPAWLRARNDRTAFRLLLEHGPLTRSRLGELSGLSKPTAAQMLTRLERVGLIGPVGEVSAGRGPNAISYGVRTDRITGVAISMLENSIHAVVVDAVDHDHPIVQIATDDALRTPEGDVRSAVRAATRAAGIAESSVSRVVVGLQAAVFVDGDELSFTDTLPGWPDLGARRRIESALGLTVTLDNDANLAAMAERAAGVARDAASFVLLWMGGGLGVGIDLGGVVHRGDSGGAGEIGYLAVPRAAAALNPDAADFTDLLGGPAVVRLLGGAQGDALADVLPRLQDDEQALVALADSVVLAVDPLLAVLDPSMVVLGGPTGIAGGDRLAALVADRVDPAAHPKLTVRTSGTGVQPVLLGARHQLVEQIRDQLEADVVL